MSTDDPNPLTITIEDKLVFGQVKYYPACDKSQTFANMLGQTTLTRQDLVHVLHLGYTINYKHNTPVVTL